MTVRAPGGATNGKTRTGAGAGGTSEGATSEGAASEGAASVLASVESGLSGFVGSFDPTRFSGDDAASLVRSFARIERLALAGKTLAAKRAASSDIHRRAGQRTSAEWLAGETGESVGDAIDTLRLGDALSAQPGVEDAFRGGKLSQKKARVISGAVGENPDAEAELLDGAEHDSLRRVQEKATRARAQRRSAEDERRREERLRAKRMCRTWTDPADGMTVLSGRFTPTDGARLRSMLERATDRVFRRARKAGIEESRDAYQADALVGLLGIRDTGIEDAHDVLDGDSGQDGDSVQDTGADGDTGTDGADAATGTTPRQANGASTTPAANTTPAAGGAAQDKGTKAGKGKGCGSYRTDTVHVRIDLDALRAGYAGPGRICEIPGIGPISVERAREILGDALVKLVITNGVDVPTIVNVKRGIPAPVASALLERDPTCVVPGCDQNQRLQTDHWKVDFAKKGPTQWWNLCPFHHSLKTKGLFHLDRQPDGSWTFTATTKGRATGYGPNPPPDPDPPDPDPPDTGDPTLLPRTE